MTSANLNIHLSEKWPKWLRTGSLRAFDGRIARSSSFSSFRVEGDYFDPPPPWRRWLRPPPGRGLNGLSPSPQRFQFLTSVYPGFSVSEWFRRPLLGVSRAILLTYLSVNARRVGCRLMYSHRTYRGFIRRERRTSKSSRTWARLVRGRSCCRGRSALIMDSSHATSA